MPAKWQLSMAYNVQAAEKAAAQSDREINGYRIESISVTHDRHTHYQRQAVTPSQVPAARLFCILQRNAALCPDKAYCRSALRLPNAEQRYELKEDMQITPVCDLNKARAL